MSTWKHTVHLATVLILSLSLLLSGCSDDASPTGPPAPEPEPMKTLYTWVTLIRVECIKDGDGIEGIGEFTFESNLHDDDSWNANMSSGDSSWHYMQTIYTDDDYTGEGRVFQVVFKATEWDRNVLNRVFPDADMDNRIASANYVAHPDLEEINYITLGNDRCKVRLHYSITSDLVARAN